ncbi:LPXTG cell wall anchor domain-containing protein [Staphylococcus petrasii]|uniref:LPXTG cell wall anchor domain-containing protein n=1 Tax=Staphylococcus petrasii TaxID=1276936 RepID=UPI001F57D2A5|nr:LPXTG cell wall anchor domain-containing protein [Staphylococcus petrasii]MCI2775030.1 LPXTG cell wall anchor domain-containing protein [Staphylococcus petrasii]
MKKVNLLGATTLAGTLLFTGVGAYQAHAETQEYTLPTPEKWQERHDEMLEARLAHPNQGGEGGGPGAINSYDKSYQEYVQNALDYEKQVGGIHFIVPQEGKDLINGVNNQPTTNNKGNSIDSEAKNQSSVANNNQQTTNLSNNKNVQEQSQTKALPETGEQSNSGLVTILASVLLATGSLLTFKRFSNNK